MAIYCVTVHNQPQDIVPEIFVQNAQIHRPVWNHKILWLMNGVKYDILENARDGARRFGSVWFYRQPLESEIPRFSPATKVMCAVCGSMRWGVKGRNIAVYTAMIGIQDIVDIQRRTTRYWVDTRYSTELFHSIQDIPILSRAHKMEYGICLYTQDIGLELFCEKCTKILASKIHKILWFEQAVKYDI